jgi:hypothetical protein
MNSMVRQLATCLFNLEVSFYDLAWCNPVVRTADARFWNLVEMPCGKFFASAAAASAAKASALSGPLPKRTR